MKTDAEWAKELADLGIQCCGFWKLDEKGKEKMMEYFIWQKKQDDKEDANERQSNG